MPHASPEWLNEGLAHIWHPYAQMQTMPTPLPVIATDKVRITLADGSELIDGISSWWSTCHGYSHPHIMAAMHAQIERFSHVMFAGLSHAPAYQLATRLSAVAPRELQRVFFSDSGSIAVEVAMKMALQYWRNKGENKRNKFICFHGSYHGDTFGAMSVSSKSPYNAGYDTALSKHYVFDIPRDEYGFAEFEDTMAAIRGSVAGLIIEPLVQCAGGFHFHSADILSEIRRVCREQEVIMIADEIATGFGRTGSFFACHEAGISPDIMCVGKALTAGAIPLSATLCSDKIFNAFLDESFDKALMHGPTFMANPLACAAALASLELFDAEPRMIQIERIEQQLREELLPLSRLPSVRDVRVKGAIGVVEIEADAARIRALRTAFIKHGVWLRPFGNVIYIIPPFIIEPADLTTLTQSVKHVLAAE